MAHVGLIDPQTKTLEVFRREPAAYLRLGAWRRDARPRAEPFEAIELELAALWADVEPETER